MNTPERWRWLWHGGEGGSSFPTTDELLSLVELIAQAVPGAAACSLTEMDGPTYRTVQESSPLALDLDLAQYSDGDGPCMTAARDRQPQYVPDTSSAPRFVAFATAAAGNGVGSSLSVPIRTAYHPAALNIYSHRTDDFDSRGQTLADLVGRALTARMVGAAPSSLTADERLRAAQRRRQILAAQQRLCATTGGTVAETFGELARRSAREGRSIFDVAADVVRTSEVS